VFARGSWLVALALASGCAGARSAMNAQGPASRQTKNLAVGVFIVAGVVFAVVAALLLVAVLRGRRRDSGPPESRPPSTTLPIWAGAVVPAVVLAVVLFFSFGDLRAQTRGGASETVEITGHRWWWQVRYGNGATSANELRLPVGVRVRLRITSDDVIHSFWIPALGGKRDAIPGRWTELYCKPTTPGRGTVPVRSTAVSSTRT
jgi:cytochrome c oxidase subunit 2